MPVMMPAPPDEKRKQAEAALRGIERFLANPNNGLTPDQRQQLTKKKMRLRSALERYKKTGGARGTTTGVVANTSVGNPAAMILVLLMAALAAAGIAAVNTANQSATVELDAALEDARDFFGDLITARGESTGSAPAVRIDELVIATAGLALATVATVSDAKVEKAKVESIDAKIRECLEERPDRIESCRALLEAYQRAVTAYRSALWTFIRSPLGLGRRQKLQRIRDLRRAFLQALYDLVNCLGCTGITFKKKKKGL